MALEGRLSEFSAAEALMLIAREEKSGRLLIEHSAGRLVLHFDRGRVAQGRDPNISSDDTFLQLLREANVLSHEQWKSLATRARERPGRDPIEGLLVIGVASREQLKEWLLMHAQGVMDHILELPDGSFNFVSSPKAALFSLPLAEKTEIMVMEAGRRSDEGKELIATQLDRSGVPILLPGSRPVPTDPYRGALLRLIDGNRSIGEMLDRSAIPQYDLVTLLKVLVERDLCAIRKPPTTGGSAAPKQSVGAAVGRVAAVLLAVAFVVVSVFVGVKLWSGFGSAP